MELKDFLKKQLQTEKSTKASQLNKYSFLIDPRVDKEEIKNTFESVFKVTVKKINTSNLPPRDHYLARYRRHVSRTALKRAVITIKKGESLDLLSEEKKKEAKK